MEDPCTLLLSVLCLVFSFMTVVFVWSMCCKICSTNELLSLIIILHFHIFSSKTTKPAKGAIKWQALVYVNIKMIKWLLYFDT